MHDQIIKKALLAALFAVSLTGSAFAQRDSGTASEYPWSGFWWAYEQGGLTGPLGKYDKVHGTRTAAWEQTNHVERDNIESWFGHCHAWSAASVTEKEPKQVRQYKGVDFGVGDLKGLLTALHAQDEANIYGDRYGDGKGSEDPQDLPPSEVWRLLQLHIRQQNIPLIFDLSSDSEVWNYPVYQYEVEYQEASNGVVHGTMTLVAADDDVYPDYIGTQPYVTSYTFSCRMQGGTIISGTDRWTGESVDDHPDFAWYPYVSRAENPGVQSAKVAQIVGASVGGADNPPDGGSTPPNSNEPPSDGLPPPPVDNSSPGPAGGIDFDRILSPIETVSLLTNKTSHFGLDIFVDRNDGGRYRAGEPVRIAAESDREGYLYLFDIDPSGNMHLVFPRPGEPNRIAADRLMDIPLRSEEPWFVAQIPGEHHLRGVVTTTPLTLTGFHTVTGGKKRKGKYKRGVQKMRVPPPTYKRMTKHLLGYYSKNVERKPPGKIKTFAQDDCLFFVTGK